MLLLSRFAVWLAPFTLAGSVVLGACGGGDDPGTPTPSSGDDGGSEASFDDSGSIFGNQDVVSIKVDPPTASIEVLNGAPASQGFTVTATYRDQTTAPLTRDVTWSVPN